MGVTLMSEQHNSLRNKNESGMSLIEVMVAMMLFSIGILSLGMFIPASQKRIMHSNLRTNSVVIAQDLMEQVMEASYAGMDAYNGTLDPVPNTNGYQATLIIKNSSAQGDTTLVNQDPDYKRIIIIVKPSGGGEPVSMSTVVSSK